MLALTWIGGPMLRRTRFIGLAAVVLMGASVGVAAPAVEPEYSVTVDPSKPGVSIDDRMYGIFIEDINFAADGGLYAELVRNRSFEHGDAFTAWGLVNRGGNGTLEVAS